MRYVKRREELFSVFSKGIVEKFRPVFNKSACPTGFTVENSVENVDIYFQAVCPRFFYVNDPQLVNRKSF